MHSWKQIFCISVLIVWANSVVSASPELFIPMIDRPPTLQDFLEMKPVRELETKLTKIEGFIQSNPSDGTPATQKTVVYIAYDHDSLYVIFVCYDNDPKKIVASMTRRENFSGEEDWIEMYLDTFNDQRRAYCMSTNAFGVQWDSRYSDQTDHQQSFDALWYSDGKITSQGYVVWMKIPFKSIRFPPTSPQTWRISFGRSFPRNNEYDGWPHVSKEIQGRLTQSSILRGLDQISPGKNIQLIPYASFRSFRFLDTENTPARFITDKSDPAAGLDAKFVLKDSFVFDFALNPDFSQVESDEPQVTINQRFEVFFEEKRPFFLENAQYFETPMNLVFTRRIADPQFGGRLTSKYGPYTVGFLATNDEAPGKGAPTNSPVSGKNAYFGILRLSRDVFKQSNFGLLLTTRSFNGTDNTVFGLDFTLRLNDKWQAVGQAVRSWTHLIDPDSAIGEGYKARLTRTGLHFNYETAYNDLSPEFQTATGFIPRTDFRSLTNTFKYYFRPEGNVLVAWGPEFATSHSWDYQGTRLDSSYNPGLYLELKRQTFIRIGYFRDRERLRTSDFAGLPNDVDFPVPSWSTTLRSGVWRTARIEFDFTRGDDVNFVPVENALPTSAKAITASAGLLVLPLRNLQLRNSYIFSDLQTPEGETIFDDHIFRTRATYQLTRNLSLRLIVQYEATIANEKLTSLEDRRNLNADFLITYLVNPWTALYVGYNSNRQNLSLTHDEDGVHLIRTTGSLMNDANQFFLKFSYLLGF
jgi:hypothetical protein